MDAPQDLSYLATLPTAITHYGRQRPDAVALRFEGRDTTYAQLDANTNRIANALIHAGLRPGSHIAYIGKNSDHYFELWMGAAKAGVVMVPVSWRLAPPEVEYIAAHSDAELLFAGPESVALVRAIVPSLPQLRGVVAMEDPAEGTAGEGDHGDGWCNYVDWRDAQPATPPAHQAAREDVALQLYTSGTTGRPKGVLLTHAHLTNGMQTAEREGVDWAKWRPDDVSLVAMPVSHIGGSGWGLMGLLAGARGVVAREFDPGKVLGFIEGESISKLFMVPAALQFVLRDPRAREADYSRLRYILYGASPIPAPLLRECIEVFGCGFVQNYGMTETTGTVVALGPEDHTTEDVPRMKSAGRALPGVEAAVIDPEGNLLPPGQSGEIIIRSRQNMAGYWKQPEETARTQDTDGWLRTGDAGYIDEDGYVYIHDRIKDLIISGGENVSPAEIESALYGHPDVADVAVIGVPDEQWGEAVKAVIVLKPGAQQDPQGLLAWARQRLAGFKVPKSVDYIDMLPRNPSGKILRRKLREPYWEGYTRRVN